MAKTTPRYVPKAEFDNMFNSVCNWGRGGPDDERGTLNYIGTEQVRRTTGLARSGQSVSVAVPINKTAGPDNPRPAAHYMVQHIHTRRNGSFLFEITAHLRLGLPYGQDRLISIGLATLVLQ